MDRQGKLIKSNPIKLKINPLILPPVIFYYLNNSSNKKIIAKPPKKNKEYPIILVLRISLSQDIGSNFQFIER